jgi:hypothetical protein
MGLSRGLSESIPVFDIQKYQFPVSFRLKKENHGNRVFLQI